MKTFFTLLFSLISFTILAQRTFLAIYTDEDKSDVIMYPPGTVFKLYDASNKRVLDNNGQEGTYNIDGNYTLYVFPTWKDDKDVFELNQGRIEILKTPSISETEIKHSPITSHGITVTKTLSNSTVNPGMKNVILEFSNGIIFKYTDGKVEAFQNKEPLRIEYKYLVYSDLGVTKISYNPERGTVWWIFEEN